MRCEPMNPAPPVTQMRRPTSIPHVIPGVTGCASRAPGGGGPKSTARDDCRVTTRRVRARLTSMNKQVTRKLTLRKESLTILNPAQLRGVQGGTDLVTVNDPAPAPV